MTTTPTTTEPHDLDAIVSAVVCPPEPETTYSPEPGERSYAELFASAAEVTASRLGLIART